MNEGDHREMVEHRMVGEEHRMAGEEHRMAEEEHHKVEVHTLAGHHRAGEEHRKVEGDRQAEVRTLAERHRAGEGHRMAEEHTLAERRRAEVHTLAGHHMVEGDTEVEGHSKQAVVLVRSIQAEVLVHKLAAAGAVAFDPTSIRSLYHALSRISS